MVDYEELTEEQQQAADALDRNVTLTAGAGTGKTTTLTARYLRLIERKIDDDDGEDGTEPLLPEEIVTTTFTERAANELKESVRKEITNRISDLDPDEYERWRTVADNLEHGYIHTLHGFCARLLRENAIRVDEVDPGFDTLDENETAALINDTVVTVLEDYDNHDAVRTLARRFDRSDLHAILTDLLRERPESVKWADRWVDSTEDEYLNYVQSHLHPIAPAVAAELLSDEEFIEAVRELDSIIADPPDIDTGGDAWERAEGVLALLEERNYDDGVPSRSKQALLADLCDHLTTSDGDAYSSYTGASSRWGNAESEKERFDRAIETVVEVISPEEHLLDNSFEVDANSFPFVQALAELTLIAAEEYEDRKDQQNVVDFTDQIQYAVSFLADDINADVRDELREQFVYVMVDEFQDTDPRQWELIKLLTSEDPDVYDARNVFVVGDVKQSIYRFRNADVTQFQETARTLEATTDSHLNNDESNRDDDDAQLSINFRTLPTVLTFINELFDEIFVVDGEPYEAEPQPLTAFRDDPADLGSVEYLAVPSDPDLRDTRFDHYPKFATARPEHDAELEAKALAARLTQILDEPFHVYETEEEEDQSEEDEDRPSVGDETEHEGSSDPTDETPATRPIEPNDIAILLRSRTHLKAYERALEDEEVPYSVASGLGFYETPEVTTLINLLKALADPADERALYAVLRSPLFGLTDDTLAHLKQDGQPLWKALSETEHDELQTVYEQLTEWRAHAGVSEESTSRSDESWAAFLTRVIKETGYLVSISADERPTQGVANVQKFREQLRSWSDDGVRSLTTLVDRIDRRTELGEREGEADIPGESEGVQVLTVHDAKGMEFPVVVVPGLSRDFNDEASIGNGRVEFEQIDDEYAIGMKAPDPDDPFEMSGTVAREAIREQRRAEERAEEKRVLYVACTRARDHLLLTGLHDLEDEDDEPTLLNLEDPDTESPSSWRDWVQPHLLDEPTLEALTGATTVEQSLGEGVCTVSLPTPAVDWEDERTVPEPTYNLSERPEQPPVRFRLTPTQLASLFDEQGSLSLDEETRTIYFEGEDKDYDTSGTEASHSEEVAPTVFGEIVHRLCELRPPEERWPDVIRQTLEDEDADQELTPELQRRVHVHVDRALSYVDKQVSNTSVEAQYDELYVTAEFEDGEISGLIDHLIVTPETYHVIDYKTGTLSIDELEEEAEYYRTQLEAYAVALHQQRPNADVQATLYFTDIGEPWSVTWDSEQLEKLSDRIQSEIGSRIEEQLD